MNLDKAHGSRHQSVAGYELADRSTEATRSRNLASVVPSVEGRLSVHWFPWEAIEFQIGYDFFRIASMLVLQLHGNIARIGFGHGCQTQLHARPA